MSAIPGIGFPGEIIPGGPLTWDGDSLSFEDYLVVLLSSPGIKKDQMSFSDSQEIIIAYSIALDGYLPMFDGVSLDPLGTDFGISLSDSFEFSDLCYALLPTTVMTNYLRRYLNDVQR